MAETHRFRVNGREVASQSEEATLLMVLRNELGLRGTRFGCGLEQCGACVVLVDGAPRYSCTLPLADAAGRDVQTVEGLAKDSRLDPLQQAFIDEQAGQCGYCLSGILMAARALLNRIPQPSRAQIVEALDGHLCRCGSHLRIIRAIERAAAADAR
jgi:nicotinate dehydrogenase subunit A